MKKSSLLLMLGGALSFTVSANPYVELEYGYSHLSHDTIATYPSDGITLAPEKSSSVYGGVLGYQLTDRLGVELSYSYTKHDADTSKFISATGGVITEDEFNIKLKSSTMGLGPVYRFELSDKLFAKAKFALTYTKYKISSQKSREEETVATDTEVNTLVSSMSTNHKKYGVLAGIGLEYNVYHNVYLGALASYKYDKSADALQLVGTLGYRF